MNPVIVADQNDHVGQTYHPLSREAIEASRARPC
jgi:hypothetical protein